MFKKRLKIDLPYVEYTMKVTFADIDNHPDARVRENVRSAMGARNYDAWGAAHAAGRGEVVEMTNRIHILDYLKDPYAVGTLIGTGLMIVAVLASLPVIGKLIWIGAATTYELLKGLL